MLPSADTAVAMWSVLPPSALQAETIERAGRMLGVRRRPMGNAAAEGASVQRSVAKGRMASLPRRVLRTFQLLWMR
jgi:hypothetical protein